MPGCNLFHPPPGRAEDIETFLEQTSSAAGITQGKSRLSSWHLSQPKHYSPRGHFRTPLNGEKHKEANSLPPKAAPAENNIHSTKADGSQSVAAHFSDETFSD